MNKLLEKIYRPKAILIISKNKSVVQFGDFIHQKIIEKCIESNLVKKLREKRIAQNILTYSISINFVEFLKPFYQLILSYLTIWLMLQLIGNNTVIILYKISGYLILIFALQYFIGQEVESKPTSISFNKSLNIDYFKGKVGLIKSILSKNKKKLILTSSLIVLIITGVALMDDISYLYAKINNDISSYTKYIENNPEGGYITNAKSNIKNLEFEAEKTSFEVAKILNTLESYNVYLNDYPTGSFVNEARSNLNELKNEKDNSAYKLALQKNTIEGYQSYISEFPYGNKIYDARDSIESIKYKPCRDLKKNAIYNGSTVSFNGNLASSQIVFKISKKDGMFKGQYAYKKYMKWIDLKGRYESTNSCNIKLIERFKGKPTGYWYINYNPQDYSISGKWVSPDRKKEFPITLTYKSS